MRPKFVGVQYDSETDVYCFFPKSSVLEKNRFFVPNSVASGAIGSFKKDASSLRHTGAFDVRCFHAESASVFRQARKPSGFRFCEIEMNKLNETIIFDIPAQNESRAFDACMYKDSLSEKVVSDGFVSKKWVW